MLKILLIIRLSRRISAIAIKKGHRPRPNIIFFIVMWIAGEFIGAMAGAFLAKGHIWTTYVMALLGAVVGAIIAFRVVNNLEDLTGNDDDLITIDGDR